MPAELLPAVRPQRAAWNRGRIIGQKRPLLPKQVWSIRVRLEMADNRRDLALFNMANDSKLRGCDLVRLRVPMSSLRVGPGSGPRSSRARPASQLPVAEPASPQPAPVDPPESAFGVASDPWRRTPHFRRCPFPARRRERGSHASGR